MARAEAALMAEGSTAVAGTARRRRAAGVGDQIHVHKETMGT